MAQRSGARISIVMVSWHTGPALFDAIEAALAAPEIDELVFVNHDNPADVVEALEALAAREPRFRLISTGANLGFARGCNIGAAAASGDRLLFLNPDTVLPAGAAARMAETGAAFGESWIVGARIVHPDGREQRGGRRGALTLATAIGGYLGLSRLLPWVRDIHREAEPLPAEAVDTPTVSGAAMMTPRAAFEAAGGFDEGYFLHVEDIDLCRRVREAGGRVVFEPRAEVVHHGATSRADLMTVEAHKARGFARYFWKFSPAWSRPVMVLTIPVICAAIMSRAAWLRVRGVFSPPPSPALPRSETRRP
ncbi:glycosyltransferase family 2 protein [Marinicauda salina]|uniref:Glycosyltransferase family 2 protein n=1 Tax=Marinicauda salina TaxID=2135793 RepID=A0A2U2BQP6_9PROT|nr:glycosyltransferase family 2 protein [Marinicauda salina]PWE16333.1 glycosyltransferase family 2 protein [Marinicauda salina]